MRRNGGIFSQRNEYGTPGLPILEVSLKTGVRVRDTDGTGRKQVMSDHGKYKCARRGDIAYNTMRMWQGAVGVTPTDGLISPAYVVARPTDGVVPSYYANLFRTPMFKKEVINYSRGIVMDRNRLYWDQFKQISVPAICQDEQLAIVRFLTHVTSQIDRTIKSHFDHIALLREQSLTILNRLVTLGVAIDSKLKPTGVPWLSNTPAHWEVVPFKRRVGFQEGPGIMAVDFRDNGIPLLRISCLRGSVATLSGCNYLDPAKVRSRWDHFRVKAGDYLLSASASTGSVVLADEVVAGSIPYTGIIRLWPRSVSVYMPFISHVIASRPFQDQIDAAKSGVGIEHFGPTHLKEMILFLPPLSEQKEIVPAIELRCSPLNRAITSAQNKITILRDYRIRLIADIVTGKLDVRTAAASLPVDADQTAPVILDGDDLDADEDAIA